MLCFLSVRFAFFRLVIFQCFYSAKVVFFFSCFVFLLFSSNFVRIIWLNAVLRRNPSFDLSLVFSHKLL